MNSIRAEKASLKTWALLVAILALLVRLGILFLYQPVSYSDTPSYRRLAGAVLRGFARYDGTRTPGYPVFLALVGTDQHAWWAQLALGFITTLLLFYLAWKVTGKPWFGGLVGLAHSLNLGQLFFESNLLTESLTTFLLVLSMVGVLLWFTQPKYQKPWLALLVGLFSTFSLLVRPLFIYLPFLLLIAMGWSARHAEQPSPPSTSPALEPGAPTQRKPFRLWPSMLAGLFPVLLLLGGWVSFIHARFGDWSLTTMTGYHLMQHTGSFFEYVPDEYAALRDTYIRYRDAHIAAYGTQTNTIWEAIPELSKVSGYNFYDLSRLLARLSIQLILHHPWLFIKNAVSGWWMFWRTSVYWSPEALHSLWLAPGITLLISLQRLILFAVNLVFILSSALLSLDWLLSALRHRSANKWLHFATTQQRDFFWLVAAVIWAASILQTLLDHGDNPRFLVPLQSLVLLWVAVLLFTGLRSRPARNPDRSIPA